MNLQEGLGDNDEIHRMSGGEGSELEQINLSNIGAHNGVTNSSRKRKRGEHGERNKEKKREKLSVKREIVDALNRISDAFESQTASIQSLLTPDSSMGEIIAEISQIEEIANDDDWFGRCCTLLRNKDAWAIYSALKDNRRMLLAFLKHAAYNPPKNLVPPFLRYIL
ncbi:uncharacterized protein LOC129318948 [Prosopis cineraria]|uniref:uncharacterized protein LOC129318948 n=1 Tax=Prosopis cineraria TaxID=364024 RepID=UPI00240FB2D5|nr:uncharacterized protein LOC129318948 [Prosopis cineraria]